jgi:hypothetical protein
VYLTLNPVKRDLLARASNRLESYAKHTSSDNDITERRWLLIDFDPVRSAGISSTDAEHDAALERAKVMRETLAGWGWPAPIFADSGNGAHLLYRIDLPNDGSSRDLLKQVLASLDAQLSDKAVAVDRTTFNAARISKLYGTPARKGDSTPERPHRLSRIVEVPQRLEVIKKRNLNKSRHFCLFRKVQPSTAIRGAANLSTWRAGSLSTASKLPAIWLGQAVSVGYSSVGYSTRPMAGPASQSCGLRTGRSHIAASTMVTHRENGATCASYSNPAIASAARTSNHLLAILMWSDWPRCPL